MNRDCSINPISGGRFLEQKGLWLSFWRCNLGRWVLEWVSNTASEEWERGWENCLHKKHPWTEKWYYQEKSKKYVDSDTRGHGGTTSISKNVRALHQDQTNELHLLKCQQVLKTLLGPNTPPQFQDDRNATAFLPMQIIPGEKEGEKENSLTEFNLIWPYITCKWLSHLELLRLSFCHLQNWCYRTEFISLVEKWTQFCTHKLVTVKVYIAICGDLLEISKDIHAKHTYTMN